MRCRPSAERWALLALAGELCSSSLELECNRHLGLENASRRTSSPCLFLFEQARLAVVGCDCLLRGKRLSVQRGGITRRSCWFLQVVVVALLCVNVCGCFIICLRVCRLRAISFCSVCCSGSSFSFPVWCLAFAVSRRRLPFAVCALIAS